MAKTTKPLNLADYLRKRSKEICLDNDCTEDQHYCESNAYIDTHNQLIDICISDYFCGSTEPYAVISLPWHGNQKDLEAAVESDIAMSQI